MVQNRVEMNWDEEELDSRPARDSFMPLFDQPEQSGYLPSAEDQSWREREATRLGYFAPREEATRPQDVSRAAEVPEEDVGRPASPELDFAGAESAEPQTVEPAAAAPEIDEPEIAAPETAELEIAEPEIAEPEIGETEPIEAVEADFAGEEISSADEGEISVPPPVVVDHGDFRPQREFSTLETGGRSGKVFMLALVAAVGLVALLPFAFPQTLTADFWNTQLAGLKGMPGSPAEPARATRTANVPAPSAPVAAPVLRREPVAPLPVEPAPAANASETATQDAPAPAPSPPNPQPRQRAAVPAKPSGGGFYAMVPGPDGTLTSRYFSSDSEQGSQSRPAVPKRNEGGEEKGVYAMAPGPDGTLRYQYFPPKPPR